MIAKNRIVQVFIGLALAVAGSATWDFVAKPLLVWIGDGVLILGTLGIDSLRDGIYQDIGSANLQLASAMSLNIIIAACLAFGISTLMGLFFVRNISQTNNLERKIRTRSVQFLLIPIMIFGMSTLLYMYARTIYVASAVGLLDRYQRISAPRLSEDERVALRARAASIQSRSDFVKILIELEGLVSKSGVPVRRVFVL